MVLKTFRYEKQAVQSKEKEAEADKIYLLHMDESFFIFCFQLQIENLVLL